MGLRRGSNFYLFYDHIIAGGHFTDLALWFRSRHRSFLWNRSLGLTFGGRLSGLDLRPCWGLRGGFAASPRRRRSFLAEPCCLRRMSASLDFRFLRGLASMRRHSLNYSCRRGIVKRGNRREDKTWSAESYWLNPSAGTRSKRPTSSRAQASFVPRASFRVGLHGEGITTQPSQC